MSPLFKKILLIALLLTVTILLALGLYYFFRRPTPPPSSTGPTNEQTKPGQLPGSGERSPGTTSTAGVTGETGLPSAGTITPPAPNYFKPPLVEKLTNDSATYPSLSSNGMFRYYNAADGKFYRLLPDGTLQPINDQVFYNVNKVTWAKSKDQAVMEYPDGTKTIYNFDLKKQTTIPRHWQDFTFSPDSNQLSAKSIGLSPENRWLIVTKDDGTDTRLVEPLGDNADKVTMNWSPARQTVALSQTGQPLGADRREVLFVGLNGENFKSTIVEGLDFQPQWSPTGKKLLYSVDSARNDFKPELWIVDSYGESIGGNRKSLQINTWANKCAFSGDDVLFCAIPRTLPSGAGMAPEVAFGTPDDLYKIDLRTGLKTSIPVDQDYSVDNISYDSTHHKLFFNDHRQSGVFQISL